MRNPRFLVFAAIVGFLFMYNTTKGQDSPGLASGNHANSIEDIISRFRSTNDCASAIRIEIPRADVEVYRQIAKLQKKKLNQAFGVKMRFSNEIDPTPDTPPSTPDTDTPMYICKGRVCPCSTIDGGTVFNFIYSSPREASATATQKNKASPQKQYKMSLIYLNGVEKTIPSQAISKKGKEFKFFTLSIADSLYQVGLSRLRIEETQPNGEKRIFCLYIKYNPRTSTPHGNLIISHLPIQ